MSNATDSASSSAQNFTSNAGDFAKVVQKLGKATLKDLSRLTGNTLNAIESSSDTVSNWNFGILSSFSSLTNSIGSTGKGNAKDLMTAVNGILKIADSLVGGVFKSVDTALKLQDSVAGIGVSATKTTTDLVDMAKKSGYPIDKAHKLMETFNSVGESLTYLAPNTGKAVERLSKVFDNRADQLKYLKQGLNPENLMRYQAEGVKFLTGYGVKLSEDDTSLRKSTLAYVDTLTTMSILTGENKDQVAARLAALKTDASYQIKMRELIKSGNSKGADELSKTMVLLDGVSPELKKGMADFIANGSATTVEGKKMMLVMGDKAATIAKDVEEGRMTGAEAARAVAVEYQNYINKNKQVLSVSKELQNATGINGKVLMETERLSTVKSEADAKTLIEQNAKKGDAKIDSVNAMINAERDVGFIKDEINAKMRVPALITFKALTDTVKRTAFYLAEFAAGINGGKYDAGLEKIMMVVGDQGQLGKMKDKAQAQLANINTNIERIKNPEKRSKELADKSKAAEAEFNRLSDTHAAPAQIESARKTMQNAKQAESAELQEQRKLKDSGMTVEQLESQRYQLEERSRTIGAHYTAATTSATAAQWEERKEQEQVDKQKLFENVMKTDLGDAKKYIQFNPGSGDEQHWAVFSSRNPALAKNVTLLAQEYFKQTNQKLSLSSSFRSYDEQKALYQGWVKAGGSSSNPAVNVPGHGMVNTPANPDVKETPHMGSTAIDISKDQLDWMEGRGLLQRMGLKRPYRNDPVHIEKAKFGKSLIQGKEIEMHGREALIELFNGTIPINLPPDFKENTFSDIKDTIKPKATMQPVKPKPTMDKQDDLDLDLLDKIDSQFDELIASMDKSNLLQHSIKTYMAA
jgi:hypothetical protein